MAATMVGRPDHRSRVRPARQAQPSGRKPSHDVRPSRHRRGGFASSAALRLFLSVGQRGIYDAPHIFPRHVGRNPATCGTQILRPVLVQRSIYPSWARQTTLRNAARIPGSPGPGFPTTVLGCGRCQARLVRYGSARVRNSAARASTAGGELPCGEDVSIGFPRAGRKPLDQAARNYLHRATTTAAKRSIAHDHERIALAYRSSTLAQNGRGRDCRPSPASSLGIFRRRRGFQGFGSGGGGL